MVGKLSKHRYVTRRLSRKNNKDYQRLSKRLIREDLFEASGGANKIYSQTQSSAVASLPKSCYYSKCDHSGSSSSCTWIWIFWLLEVYWFWYRIHNINRVQRHKSSGTMCIILQIEMRKPKFIPQRAPWMFYHKDIRIPLIFRSPALNRIICLHNHLHLLSRYHPFRWFYKRIRPIGDSPYPVAWLQYWITSVSDRLTILIKFKVSNP